MVNEVLPRVVGERFVIYRGHFFELFLSPYHFGPERFPPKISFFVGRLQYKTLLENVVLRNHVYVNRLSEDYITNSIISILCEYDCLKGYMDEEEFVEEILTQSNGIQDLSGNIVTSFGYESSCPHEKLASSALNAWFCPVCDWE